jgi:hypothetical protein
MNVQDVLIAALLRAYPREWLNEYGDELRGVVKSRPLTAAIAADVVWSGVCERVRSIDLATGLGLAAMFVVTLRFASNIAAPALSPYSFTSLLQPSHITLPTIVATPLTSGVFFMLLAAFGAWTHVQTRGSSAASGRAAARVAWLAGLPFFVAGALMLFGVLNVVIVEPGNSAAALNVHGFRYFYYQGSPLSLAPPLTWWAVMLAPVFALPQAWMWGTIGGACARGTLAATRLDLPS